VTGPLSDFAAALKRDDLIAHLRSDLIGEGIEIEGPFGPQKLVYADYVASGRALRMAENFVTEQVLPYYANSHTEASFCGGYITRLRNAARMLVAGSCGADTRHATIFCGSGATAGINRLVHLLGVSEEAAAGRRPLVLIGPYEHHSNILPWRESGADIMEISEGPNGGPDLEILEHILMHRDPSLLTIGAFSAASNVTGIVADVRATTAMLKRHGARAVWDYAGGGPYLPIAMNAGAPDEIDAVVVSPHKFPGGPGASGVLVVLQSAVRVTKPTCSGGGTVRFVSPWGHVYSPSIVAREEAGTPNVVGDIRAALCFAIKDAIGTTFMTERHAALRARAVSVWQHNASIEVLGQADASALPIFSFRVRDTANGGYIHQQLFTRMLSDAYGVQARGGCACAGPYAHRLLGIDPGESGELQTAILGGDELAKPGWTRLNLSALNDDLKTDYIIAAVDELARSASRLSRHYVCDPSTARFRAVCDPVASELPLPVSA